MKVSPSNLNSDPIIRSMDFTETFQQEDTIVLTEEERKEAEQLQKDEKLRRSDPVAYNDMIIAKRNRWTNPVESTGHAFQAFNPAFDSPGQGFPDFSPAVPSTGQEPHAFSIAAMTTGQRFPLLDYTAVPALPQSPFYVVSAATSPGGPPPALPEYQSVPEELSTRFNSAPPSSANDSLPKVHKINAPPRADGNEWTTSLKSNGNRICLSPILSASTTMIPRDTASPEKQDDPAILNLRQRDIAAPELALNLNPYPPLQDLLSREAARMSKERPSSKT